MTIRHRDSFEHGLPAGYDGEFDWDFLKQCWAGSIDPTDIDAMVERKGHFLLFETKDNGKKVPLGQKIALARLVDIGRGRITVLIVRGKRYDECGSFWMWRNFKPMKPALWACTVAGPGALTQVCNQWFVHADSGKAGVVLPDGILRQYMRRTGIVKV